MGVRCGVVGVVVVGSSEDQGNGRCGSRRRGLEKRSNKVWVIWGGVCGGGLELWV